MLVVTGAGGVSFCAGADLKAIELVRAATRGADEGPFGFTRLTPCKPTIAAIDGWCLAGGLELALWCDLRIARPRTQLGFPERRWGVPLIDGGTQRLPRIVGLGRALDLILTGRIIDAAEAHGIGLVTEVVADGTAVDARARDGAAGSPSSRRPTMLADRRAALEAQGLPLADGLALEAQAGPAGVRATRSRARAASPGGEGRGGAGAGV